MKFIHTIRIDSKLIWPAMLFVGTILIILSSVFHIRSFFAEINEKPLIIWSGKNSKEKIDKLKIESILAGYDKRIAEDQRAIKTDQALIDPAL